MKPLKIIYYLTLATIALLAVLLIFSTFPIPGNYKLFVVQSGSMNPAIKMGSIVVVKPAKEYQKGEIISFADTNDRKNTITHRIFEIKKEAETASYITKGDANNAPDTREITTGDVIGKVLFSLPFIGYGVSATRQPIGFMLLIILPATLIIYDEIRKIKDQVVKMRSKKALFFLLAFSVSLMTFNFTKAFLSDTETSTGNTFQVTTWGIWIQTDKDHFEAGTLSDVDTTTSAGDVMLTGAYPVAGDTVALWHMNEGSGDTVADATGVNNGIRQNFDDGWVDGKFNKGLEFNEGDDYVQVPDSDSLDVKDAITIEAWIKIEDLPNTYSAVVSKGVSHPGSYMLHLDERTSTTFRVCPVFYISGSYGNWQVGCSSDLNYGQWYHVAVTYDGSKEKTYVNGTLQGEESRTGQVDVTSDPVELGHDSRYSVGTRHVKGIIDEVRISNTAKTSFPIDYFSSGNLESQVFDGEGVRDWDYLEWDETLTGDAGDNDITFEVNTSADNTTWSGWSAPSSDSPIDLTGITDTQYIKWRVTLTTIDSSLTPVLYEVRVRHFSP